MNEVRQAYFSRIPISSRVGEYAAHRRVYEQVAGRPVYRRIGEVALVVSKVEPTDDIECKPYAPQLEAGDRLAFTLKSDVSRSEFVRNSRGIRFDPVLAQKKKHPGVPYREIVREIGQGWLADRAGRHGFECRDIYSVEYSQLAFVRPSDQQRLRFSVLDYVGVLTVTHPQDFIATLFDGIGRGKAFGLGLLLVNRRFRGT